MSVAGLRKGLQHSELGDEETTRSGLFMDAIRVIKEMRSVERSVSWSDKLVRLPLAAIWENVPGALSSNHGDDFRVVLEELAHIADPTAVIPGPPKGKWSNYGDIELDGGSLAWRLFDAQYWGVPQRRKRLVVLLMLGGYEGMECLGVPIEPDNNEAVVGFTAGCAGAVLFECQGSFRDLEPSIPPWKGVARNPEEGFGIGDSYTLKVRGGGVERDSNGRTAGKGALVQHELSATMGVSQDQTLF